MYGKLTHVKKLTIFCSCLFLLISCSKSVAQETAVSTTPTTVVKIEATNSEVLVAPTATIAPTSTTKATATPQPTTTPIVTRTPLPTATISPLQKVGELPVFGQRMIVSLDGTLIAVDNWDTDVVYIYDVTEQSVKWELDDDAGGMTGHTALDFSPDGSLLATGGIKKDVYVWDMNNGEIIYQLPSPYFGVTNISFSADGKLLAITSDETYSADAGVLIYSMNTGELVDKFPSSNIETYPPSNEGEHFLKTFADFGWFMGEAVFLPNRPNILAITINDPENFGGENPGALYFWGMENQELKEVIKGSFGNEIALSPDGQTLIANIDNYLYGWDLLNEKEGIIQSIVGKRGTRQIAIADDGTLAWLDSDGILTLWNLNGDLIFTSEPEVYITNIAFMPNGDLLTSRLGESDDSIIERWEVVE